MVQGWTQYELEPEPPAPIFIVGFRARVRPCSTHC
jgi:hypothetical protein